MNSDELIEDVRQEVFVDASGTAFPDYDDARLRKECWDALMATFGRAITQARQGYWLKQQFISQAQFTPKVQIPYRAVNGTLEQVAIADSSTTKYIKLEEVTETRAQDYERAPGTYGQVLKYCIRADQVVLLPSPSQAYNVRLSYYLRPSKLVEPQTAGRVTAVNTTARTITVNSVPLDRDTGIAIATGASIDVVHPGGWFEVALVGAASTLAASTFTIGGTAPMDEIAVGDYVRAAGQTDWPALPEDHHRTLAKVTAVAVCKQLHMLAKADALSDAANGDMQRFTDLLVSRVKAEAPVLKAPLGVLQVGRARRGFYGWGSG